MAVGKYEDLRYVLAEKNSGEHVENARNQVQHANVMLISLKPYDSTFHRVNSTRR